MVGNILLVQYSGYVILALCLVKTDLWICTLDIVSIRNEIPDIWNPSCTSMDCVTELFNM